MRCVLPFVLPLVFLRPAAAAEDTRPLLDLIDAAVTRAKELPVRTDTHTPWEVMHAMIPFGKSLEIYDAAAKEKVNGIRWLLERAEFGGKRIFRPAEGGLEAWFSGTHFQVQDHPDQYLSKFGRSGVAADAKVLVDGKAYTVADLVNAAKLAVKPGRETAFTLTALILYCGLDAKWKNSAGEDWDIARVLKAEVDSDVNKGACGGTHGLFGLAHACNEMKKAGRPLEGPWQAAAEKVSRYKTIALAWQGPEGYFSAAFFAKAARPPSDIHLLYATGHTLEFLSLACSDEEIRSPALRKAAELTARKLLDNLDNSKLPKGTLYHAVNGLMLYRKRIGERGASAP